VHLYLFLRTKYMKVEKMKKVKTEVVQVFWESTCAASKTTSWIELDYGVGDTNTSFG
jgi:hypothetical protein